MIYQSLIQKILHKQIKFKMCLFIFMEEVL